MLYTKFIFTQLLETKTINVPEYKFDGYRFKRNIQYL